MSETKHLSDEYSTLLSPMHNLFQSGVTQTLEWRSSQLQCMKRMMKENQEEMLYALQVDLGKNRTEAYVTELNQVYTEIDFFLKNLKRWMKPESVPSPGLLMPSYSEIRSEPRGVCFIIGPFNYPLNLTLMPAIGSLGCGNPTVIKPSELCPETSTLLARLAARYFDKSILQVIEGAIPETEALLDQKWGLVFFTGSERVGKIVATSAAKRLSPVVLELGGKSPTYIDADCPDVKTAVRRIVWGKTMNSGQTCIAPDYVLCHEKHVKSFCEEAKNALLDMFGPDPEKSEFSRMVTPAHAKRQTQLIEEVESSTQCDIIFGGSRKCNAESKYVCPTVLLNPPMTSRLMQEEIFGPVLPVISVQSSSDAINVIKSMPGIPLALYVFTTSKLVYDKFLQNCPSGGALRNDVVVHFTNLNIPFGGLGSAGCGSYHGKFSFDTFSHKRGSIFKPCHNIFEFGGIRYHPHDIGIRGKLLYLLVLLPDVPVLQNKIYTCAVIFVACFLATRIDIAANLRAAADLLDQP